MADAPDIAAIERRITEYDAELNNVEDPVSRRGYGRCFDDCCALLAEREVILTGAANDRMYAAVQHKLREDAEAAVRVLATAISRDLRADGEWEGREAREKLYAALADPRVKRIMEQNNG